MTCGDFGKKTQSNLHNDDAKNLNERKIRNKNEILACDREFFINF